jgi:hypothetical protein
VQHGFHLVELTFQRFTRNSTRRDFEDIERFIYTLFGDACARSREDHVIGYLSCERCAAGVRDRFLRRRAQVSVSRGLKPCLSDLLSQAQDSFEKSLAKTTLADLVSEIRHNER